MAPIKIVVENDIETFCIEKVQKMTQKEEISVTTIFNVSS